MKDIKDLKVGDSVIFHPNFCYSSGIRKITELNGDICILENGFKVELQKLLPVPIFEVGDSVILKPKQELEAFKIIRTPFTLIGHMLDYAGKTFKITETHIDFYNVFRIGQDGVLYHLDELIWSWSVDFFDINASINLNKKKNENRLQEEEGAFLRGLHPEKGGIYGRRIKAAIAIGSLSYQTISGR